MWTLAAYFREQALRKHNLPLRRNPLFTGRVSELKHIDTALKSSQAACIGSTALKGMGGVGKTQLALEYAYNHLSQYQRILWVSADGEETLRRAFAGLSSFLQLPDTIAQEERIQQVQSWLKENQDWLIIFDNAETQRDLESAMRLLNFDANGASLFTTRTQAPNPVCVPIELDVFSNLEGVLGTSPPQITLSPETPVWQWFQRGSTFPFR